MVLATYMRHPTTVDYISELGSLSSQWRKPGASRGMCTKLKAVIIYLDLAGSNTEGDHLFIF